MSMPKSEVFLEDCFETLKRLEDKSINLFLQDTPFGVTQNKWDIKPDLQKMWPEWLRTGKDNAAFIFFATQPFASELIFSNRKLFRYDLIWYKSQATGFLNAGKMPMREHELILVFYKTMPVYYPQLSIKAKKDIRPLRKPQGKITSNYGVYKEGDFSKVDNDNRYPSSVLYFPNEQNQLHPTQKPLALIRYLIRTYSNPNDFVFDGYLGSGTTRMGCFAEGRNFIGAEMDLTYYEAQQKRFETAISEPLFQQPIIKQATLL